MAVETFNVEEEGAVAGAAGPPGNPPKLVEQHIGHFFSTPSFNS
jgi:hypothetical protein